MAGNSQQEDSMTEPGPIVLTLMVRDEVDIVAAMIEHHLDQGVDHIIATDNGSVDGTREVLAQYEALGVLELRDDPRHEMQQGATVTQMARDAFTTYGAEWVINADADEFWVASDRSISLADAICALPKSVQSIHIPVANVLGYATEEGPVLSTVFARDERSVDELVPLGLHAQPTHDCLVRGSADVEIAEGNHFSSLPVAELPDGPGIEVVHVPFRSWKQYVRRVDNMGAAFLKSPHLRPSPKHHAMRDYRWLKANGLEPFYTARFPERSQKLSKSFVEDRWLPEHLASLVARAKRPELLEAVLAEPTPKRDEADLRRRFAELGPVLTYLEDLRAQQEESLRLELDVMTDSRDSNAMVKEYLEQRVVGYEAEHDELTSRVESLTAALELTRKNLEQMQGYTARAMGDRSVRLGLAAGNAIRRVRGIVRGKP